MASSTHLNGWRSSDKTLFEKCNGPDCVLVQRMIYIHGVCVQHPQHVCKASREIFILTLTLQ